MAVVPLRRLGRSVATPPWRSNRWRHWMSALDLWLAPLSPGLRRRALQRFSVRGDVAERIRAFPKARDGWVKTLSRARGRGAIDLILAPISEEDLHALHAAAEPAIRRRIVRYALEDRMRRVPVTGDDLLEVGLAGPALGRALLRIRTAYLDRSVTNHAEAMALAREIARRSATRRKSTPRRKTRA